jgi:drug/metabolite transporter (DMT)-like permease
MLAIHRPKRATLPYLALLLSIVLWGGTSVVAKVTTAEAPIFSLLFLRFCLATLFILPLFLFDRHRPRLGWKDFGKLAVLGFIGISCNIGFFFFGIHYASVVDTSLILSLSPVVITIGSWLLFGDRMHLGNWLGLILAGGGISFVMLSQTGDVRHSLLGNILIIASMISAAIYTLLSKQFAKQYTPMTIVAVSFLVGMVTFAPLAAWDAYQQVSWGCFLDGTTLAGLVYLALGSSVIAYWCYEWALEYLSASTVAVLSYLQPLISVLLAVILLREPISWHYLAGGVLVAAGIFLALEHPHLHRKAAKHHLPTRHPIHRG